MIKEYISLQEATKYCKYSQEYLSLRARQGKLKSVKFGQSWVTTRQWLEEYVTKSEEYNKDRKKRALKNKKTNSSAEKILNKKNIVPSGLPIEKKPLLRFGFVFFLVFVLLIASVVFGKESFGYVSRNLSLFVLDFSQGFDIGFTNFDSAIKIKKDEFLKVTAYYTDSNFNKVELFREYNKWIIAIIKYSYSTINNLVEKKTLQIGQKLENLIADLGEIFLKSVPSINRH